VNKWKPLKNSSRGKTILEQLNPGNHALYKKKLQVIDTYKTFVVDSGLPGQVILFAFTTVFFQNLWKLLLLISHVRTPNKLFECH
jgi:hypothetical protein